jgi:hypothetical protein
MENLYKLADLFLPLSEDRQLEILDFAEFLFLKHLQNKESVNSSIESIQSELEPSDELKKLLKARYSEHRKNPELARKWTDVKAELMKRYK